MISKFDDKSSGTGYFDDLAANIIVPEPATIGLVGLGALGAMTLGRSRRRG
jgi:hypothetical protein